MYTITMKFGKYYQWKVKNISKEEMLEKVNKYKKNYAYYTCFIKNNASGQVIKGW